jgi:hypothetical protein
MWKYLDDGSNQGVAWQEIGYDDSRWAEGPAELGYGDGDEATVVSYGPDPSQKYTTTYFRHHFNVADPSIYTYLTLSLLRDDGAVVYLNDQEIQRSNMPDDMINWLTFAASTVSGSEEDQFFNYIENNLLIAGDNVLAVEIHQRSLTSSDISFNMSLTASTDPQNYMRKAPYLIYRGDNTRMQVLYQLAESMTTTIEWGDDLTYSLGSAQTSEYGTDHQHTFIITDLTPATKYYYRVTVGAYQYTGHFYAAPLDNAGSVKFFAYGDTRTYPGDHNEVANGIIDAYMNDEDYQTLIISVGDLVTDGDIESDWYEEFFDPQYEGIQTLLRSLPYQSCMGNHEGDGLLFQKYFPYPYVNSRYWSFDYGPVHFSVVDQYTDRITTICLAFKRSCFH